MLICTLSIRDSKKAFFWTSRFERDVDQKITGFTDQLQCQPMESSGRFMEIWKLERWMGPHVVVNYATVLKALGRDVDEKWIKAARMAEEMAPPSYPFLRLNVEDVVAALRRMTIGQIANVGSRSSAPSTAAALLVAILLLAKEQRGRRVVDR